MPVPIPSYEDRSSYSRNARLRHLPTFEPPLYSRPFTFSTTPLSRDTERRSEHHSPRVRRATQQRGSTNPLLEDPVSLEPADEEEVGEDVLGDLLGYAAFSQRASARTSATASTAIDLDAGGGGPAGEPPSRRGALLFGNDDDIAAAATVAAGDSAPAANPDEQSLLSSSSFSSSPFASEHISSLLYGALNTMLSYRRPTLSFPTLADPSDSSSLATRHTSRRSVSLLPSTERDAADENEPEEDEGMDFETMLRLLSEQRTHGGAEELNRDDTDEVPEDEDSGTMLRRTRERMWGWEAELSDDDDDTEEGEEEGDEGDEGDEGHEGEEEEEDEENEDEEEDEDENEDEDEDEYEDEYADADEDEDEDELDEPSEEETHDRDGNPGRVLDSSSDSGSIDSLPTDSPSPPRSPIPRSRSRLNPFVPHIPSGRHIQFHPDSIPLMAASYRPRFLGPPPDPDGERQESHARHHQRLARQEEGDRCLVRHRGVLFDPDGVRVEVAGDGNGFWSRFKGRFGAGSARREDDAYDEEEVAPEDRREEYFRSRIEAIRAMNSRAGFEDKEGTEKVAQVEETEFEFLGR